jgi:hypothetical protein
MRFVLETILAAFAAFGLVLLVWLIFGLGAFHLLFWLW